jgi:hypothetical protein
VSVDDDNKLDEMVNSIVAAELADIVLVKKNEMEEWQRRQDQLKYELNQTKKKVQ